MQIPVFIPEEWRDYELIDSGEGAKLERFGAYTVVRPDPRAIWKRRASAKLWENADATHRRSDPTSGEWDIKKAPPTPWRLAYKNIVFTLKPTSFKHVGVFPEQAANWDWLTTTIDARPLKVLNLFAYTGGASIAAVLAGAHVTHVDSAKSALLWAKENAAASSLGGNAIRWIEEDAAKFVTREMNRGNTYDGIIMDPPRFGRGAKGEVWKLQDDLPALLASCMAILSSKPRFLIINAYTADISSLAIAHLLADMMGSRGGTLEFGELALRESNAGRLLPNGLVARWRS